MTLHGRIHPPSWWRILRDVRQWLAWTVRMMVVGLGLAGGLLVAHRPDAWAQAAAPPALRNDLATAPSPYLRSAAQQPVAWQQWGPQAFALAAALDRPIWLDIGAYNSWGVVLPYNTVAHLLGPYRIKNLFVDVKAVVTNKMPNAPYRGAGRPEAGFDGENERSVATSRKIANGTAL